MIVDIEKGEAELLAYCEKGREIGQDADTKQPWKSPTGLGYVELTGLAYCETYDDVMKAAKARFDEYAKSQEGKLYWRKRPELDHNTEGWRYYMRLVIA